MSSTSSTEEYNSSSSWISWIEMFIKSFSNQVVCLVDQSYIDDAFNLYGLQEIAKSYESSISVLKGEKTTGKSEAVETLYYLIHQRFITTKKGMDLMKELICSGVYGKCRRVQCCRYPLLPVGLSDQPYKHKTMLYCNHCKQIYESTDDLSLVDGCAFGKTFPHLFLLMYKTTFPHQQPDFVYTPRIFGFKIEQSKEQLEEEEKSSEIAI
ncbi:casein kinase II subunit beta [Nematocida sp. AWRm80]|nr:casein kinase II subunit beta [Nematocida sp. AWRm80]